MAARAWRDFLRYASGALAFVVVVAAPAELRAAPSPADAIRATLQERYKDIRIEDIEPAQIPGLFEVYLDNGRIIYSDSTGEHLVLGKVVDTKTRQDLTAQRIEARAKVDFHKLPFEHAIRIVKGTGSRQLAVFEDPDCPYCRQLEQSLRSVSDVTVYVFLYPLEQLHPHATEHARAIWCAPDRASAWQNWMIDRKEPAGGRCGDDPLDQNKALGSSLRIADTPTLVLPDGRRIAGAQSVEELQQLLGAGSEQRVTGGS